MVEYKLKSGYTIQLHQIANSIVFSKLAEKRIFAPLPPLYETDSGEKMENEFHPLFTDAMNVYEVQKNAAAFDVLLERSITFDDIYLQDTKWKKFYKTLKFQRTLNTDLAEREIFLKYFAIDITEHSEIAEHCLLTEHQVFLYFNSIQATRDGTDLLKANIKNSVNTNINVESVNISGVQIVNPLAEFSACLKAGLAFDKWLRCEYTLEEKSIVVALDRLQSIIDIHQQDAITIESEKKNKAKK